MKRIIFFIAAVVILILLITLSSQLIEIQSLRGQIRSVETQLSALSKEKREPQYLAEGDVPFIVRELISSLPAGLKFDLKQVLPQEIKSAGDFRRFAVELEFLSNLKNLNLYLGRLEKMRTPVYVEGLTLKNAGTGEVTGRLYLNFLLLPGKGLLVGSPEVYEIEKPKPARKPRAAAAKIPRLQGVWKGKETKAVIDDSVVKAGDRVSGYKVLAIDENQVILERAGRRIILKMEEK